MGVEERIEALVAQARHGDADARDLQLRRRRLRELAARRSARSSSGSASTASRPSSRSSTTACSRPPTSCSPRACSTPPAHFDFVLGVPGAAAATAENLLHFARSIPAGCTWTVAGIGRRQTAMATLAIAMGGHVRVGFEDNIYYRKGELADSNARFVERVVRIAREVGPRARLDRRGAADPAPAGRRVSAAPGRGLRGGARPGPEPLGHDACSCSASCVGRRDLPDADVHREGAARRAPGSWPPGSSAACSRSSAASSTPRWAR